MPSKSFPQLSAIRVRGSQVSQPQARPPMLHHLLGAQQRLHDDRPLLVAAHRPGSVRPVEGLLQQDPRAPLALSQFVQSRVIFAIPLVKNHSASHRSYISSWIKRVSSSSIIREEATKKLAETLAVPGRPGRRLVWQAGDLAVGVEHLRQLLLQAGQNWGEDARLEEVQDHQGEGVAGQGLEPRLVDPVLLCPSSQDCR